MCCMRALVSFVTNYKTALRRMHQEVIYSYNNTIKIKVHTYRIEIIMYNECDCAKYIRRLCVCRRTTTKKYVYSLNRLIEETLYYVLNVNSVEVGYVQMRYMCIVYSHIYIHLPLTQDKKKGNKHYIYARINNFYLNQK